MSKIFGFLGAMFAYFCIATVLALVIAVGSMWSSGVLNKDKIYGMLAVVHGIELGQRNADELADKEPSEQLSLASISDARILHGLNIDIRETAMDKGLVHLRKVGQSVRTDKERFNLLRAGFTQRLQDLDGIASDEALQDLKKTLEVLPPELARDQIKIILEKEGGMDQIVAVVKAMPLDKRKKLLTAFEGPDGNALSDILEQIRLGTSKREL
ncbi:MAG: hypothetical protein ACI9G1_001987, partial [Pirellulaceae bacterium]